MSESSAGPGNSGAVDAASDELGFDGEPFVPGMLLPGPRDPSPPASADRGGAAGAAAAAESAGASLVRDIAEQVRQARTAVAAVHSGIERLLLAHPLSGTRPAGTTGPTVRAMAPGSPPSHGSRTVELDHAV